MQHRRMDTNHEYKYNKKGSTEKNIQVHGKTHRKNKHFMYRETKNIFFFFK